MRRRLSIPTGINIARWRTGVDKHDSVQLCNSLIFHFWDATFSSCCTQRMRKSRKIRSARTWVLFSYVFRSSIDWWWENERWLVAGNYTVKQNLLHLYIVRCCNSLLIVFHGGCEDDCRFLLASILPDEGLDWTSMILCNAATLWFFTFWDATFSSCCTQRMRKSRKIRSARTWVLFSYVFRSSIDWWWENERWLVAGNYTVKQNLLHLYIVRRCNSLLIVFHGGCEDDCRFLLASILPDEGLDWTSMILCNAATLWFFTFWDATFSSCCTQRMRKSRKIRSARTWVLFSYVFRSSIDWWWENERWLVAGNYTVKQNLLHLYIVRCGNSLLIVFHGGCEDDCRFLLASILPDEGLEWTSMILCNSATLWFFTFWMPLLLLHSEDAEVAKNSICEDMSSIF